MEHRLVAAMRWPAQLEHLFQLGKDAVELRSLWVIAALLSLFVAIIKLV